MKKATQDEKIAESEPLGNAAEAPAPPARWRIPYRAILLGLLLLPATCYWAQAQVVDRIFSLMIPPVSITLAVIAVNLVVRRFWPSRALAQGELLVFYGMQTVACAMASEWIDSVTPMIYSYGLFYDQDSHYYILPYINHLLFFTSDKGLQDFAVGGKSFSHFWHHLPIWIPKIIAWTTLASLVAFAMLCVNALMLDQWENRERFSFPLVQLPMAMTENGGASPVWRDRLFWGVFAVMFGIDMLNGFAYLYPQLPTVPVRFISTLGDYDDVSKWFARPPFNQIGWTPIGIFPFISAIGLLMPTDLLFSCLFFFFFRKVQQVIAASLGYPTDLFGGGSLVPAAPYFSEQSWGAFLGLFVGAIWTARPYLRELWGHIKKGDDLGPGRLSPRFALFALIGSLVALGFFGIAIGLPFFFVVLYILIFLAFSVAMTRLRAQLGAPTHEMAFMGPNQVFVDFHGTQGVPPAMIVNTVASFHFMNRIHRTHPMPSQLEAMYLADRSRIRASGIFVALVLATVAGTAIGHLVRIYEGYRYVPDNHVWENNGVIATLIRQPRSMNLAGILSIAAGFLFVLALDAVRFRFVGFPLHPAGYALAMNFGLDYYWVGLTLALIAKVMTLRYSGLQGYGKLRMVAFGLILGEFVAETIWAVFSMTHHNQLTYSISINGKLNWQQ
ncbi:MAG TPA: DUF6785 family protein [Capsulimonadaceae bacterium]|nr:DUF6785 family protein [Capsulimonadaceae bacterium]